MQHGGLSQEVRTTLPRRREKKGLVAVVTGASSGVGEAIAFGLARQGIKVALVAPTVANLEQVQKLIHQAGGEAEVFPCDVADPKHVDGLKETVLEHYGEPQLLVNAAGLHCELVPIAETTPSEWLRTFQVDTLGPYLICRAFMNEMIQQGWGRIINVSSAASLSEPGHIGSVYQLSKVALNFFTRQLAAELAGTGVTANVLHPGEVKTEMWAAIKVDAKQRNDSARDAQKWVEWVEQTGGDPPEKTAELVLDLLKAKSDNINGQFLWIKDPLQKPRAAW
jgi:NAD(P)-dependent dehydrogenase (short-subunit alcohol dehydrogenase family)